MNSLKTKITERRIIRLATMQLQKLATSTSTNSSEIQIPIRKERGPTDILQALKSTITRDPTAPQYKYIDDPFLIPSSLKKKRTYALSRESGKRAAAWVLQEHSDLLKSNLSEPLIQAFLPIEKYENKSQVSEEILKSLIKQGRIADVLHVYNLLEKDVTKETKQAILELLCFYNSDTEQISEMFPEERSYQYPTEVRKNVWVNNPEIESLFGELQNDEATAAGAYNALICGLAKYLKSDKAMELYNLCTEKKIPLSVTTYNHLIQLVPLLKDNTEERKVLVQSFLQQMAKNKVKPNILTLNAALKTTSTFSIQTAAKEYAFSLLAEFKTLGIVPSLASYYYILLIFYRQTGGSSKILIEIVDKLEENKKLTIRDPMDTFFFVHAMEVALTYLNDMELGDRIHKILLHEDNYKFIGGRLKESVYYRNYLQLILANDLLDEFVKAYDTLVPHMYIPEPALMKDILLTLEVNDKEKAIALLPKFASHIVMFDMLDRHHILKLLLKLMADHCTPEPESPLHQEFAKMAWTIWVHFNEVVPKKINRILWPAIIFGRVIELLVRGNEFEKAIEVLSFLVKSEEVVGTINRRSLEEIFAACVTRGHTVGALMALEYACDNEFRDVQYMIKTIKESLPLSETQKTRLINLVGEVL